MEHGVRLSTSRVMAIAFIFMSVLIVRKRQRSTVLTLIY